VRYSDLSDKFEAWSNAGRWRYALLWGVVVGSASGITTALLWGDAMRGAINGVVLLACALIFFGYFGWGRKNRERRIEKRGAEASADAG
jgi:hypothetical protein